MYLNFKNYFTTNYFNPLDNLSIFLEYELLKDFHTNFLEQDICFLSKIDTFEFTPAFCAFEIIIVLKFFSIYSKALTIFF